MPDAIAFCDMKNTTEEMVERVSWFSPADYEILIFFEEHDIIASPRVISENIGYDRQYTSKRCNVLTDAEILEKPKRGLFRLADKGRSFLAGDLDASELESDSEDT